MERAGYVLAIKSREKKPIANTVQKKPWPFSKLNRVMTPYLVRPGTNKNIFKDDSKDDSKMTQRGLKEDSKGAQR